MPKTCIICGLRAGSKEHIFPAAFGGRRTNRGIYCGRHNEAFGRHVSSLLEALDFINAAIGVIPDHHDDVRPAPIESADGAKLLLSKGRVAIAPPPPMDSTPELLGRPVVMSFSDITQAEKWIARQREAGYELEVGRPGEVKTRLLTEPLHVKRELGDESFMRAVVYLTLTFLAHRFPREAKAAGLLRSRNIVEMDLSPGERVWWERPGSLAQLSPNPFEHGHTVAIAVDGATGKVSALLSLYGAIQFGVDLGETTLANTSRATTHIDSLAARPPDDIWEIREDGETLVLATPEEGRRYIVEVTSGQVEHPFSRTFRAANDADLAEAAETLLPQLLECQRLPHADRSIALMAAISSQDQRIFNLLKNGLAAFEQVATDVPGEIHKALRLLVAGDDSSSRSISPDSETALYVTKAFIADEIRKQLEAGSLDVVWLAGMLSGREQFGIALAGVIRQVLRGFFRADRVPTPHGAER